MKDFKDKVAVVTGAASGIGRGMAETFVAGIGGLGGDGNGASWTSSLDDWHWILGVNVMGIVHGIRSFLPIMIEQDTDAHIVNTASLAGLISAGTLYGTSKFAVVGLSENVYLELRRGGFKPKMSVLCPGFVDTNIMNSDRNRPTEFAIDTPARSGPFADAIREWVAEQCKRGLSPRAVGEQVLVAIHDERFYILTHPEYNPIIEQRMRDILTGTNPNGQPPPDIESWTQKLKPSRQT